MTRSRRVGKNGGIGRARHVTRSHNQRKGVLISTGLVTQGLDRGQPHEDRVAGLDIRHPLREHVGAFLIQ